MPAVNYRWVLANTSNMQAVAELTHARNRQYLRQLNRPGSASFSIDLKAPEALLIVPLYTCVIIYRNDIPVWSGPVWTITETLNATTRIAQVTCMGWFELLNHRILKTGSEAAAVGFPTTTAITQVYSATKQETIATNLVNRTNADYTSVITIGRVDDSGALAVRNRTYNRFQNIGQEIVNISNLDAGFDFDVDPITRKLSFYMTLVKAGTTIYGKGSDKPSLLFAFQIGPDNITEYIRTIDGSRVVNQTYVIGSFQGQNTAPYVATDTTSSSEFGQFQEQISLSEVLDPTILEAYAIEEISVLGTPQEIHTLSLKPYTGKSDVPQPFVDYDVGDMVYMIVNFGRAIEIAGSSSIFPNQQGAGNSAQAIRIFSFQVDVDDAGTEHVSQLQTNMGS